MYDHPLESLVLVPVHLSFLFGFILSGNLIDNQEDPKRMAILSQTLLAAVWLVLGIYYSFSDWAKEEGLTTPPLILYFYTWNLT